MKVSELAARTKVSAHREFTDHTVREVIFISMSRDLGFSLKYLSEYLPLYRAGTLTFDQMVALMQTRIAEVDAHIAAQRAVRAKLVSHIAWLKKRKREFAKRAADKTDPSPWRTSEAKSKPNPNPSKP